MNSNYDFCGWATKNDIKCSDGRVIRRDAFKDNDGMTVPLVWNHQHNEAYNVLGHAELENRPEGVYAYCTFNNSDTGINARELVRHGDIRSLSIYANKLKQVGSDVIHGAIKEVSLVLAGANTGAKIESFFEHSDDEDDEEAIIYSGTELSLYHADDTEKKENTEEDSKMAEKDTRTIKDVFDTMNEDQKNVCYAMIAMAINGEGNGEEKEMAQSDIYEEDDVMKHNIFTNDDREDVISHAEMMEVLTDGKKYGSMKESFLAHGIDNISYLFPDAQNVQNTPEWYKRKTDWVAGVMNGVHHTPFSRIRSMYADITMEEARARGYIMGNFKVEEQFSVMKRTTEPCTVYKKQKLNRDQILDITDFDVVGWMKSEMRVMLDEEIARAILIGDGRSASSDDKINEQNIRPIWTDDDVYTIKNCLEFASNATDDAKGKMIVKEAVKSRKNYKGSGNTVLYTTEDYLSMLLLMEDTIGHRLYDTVEKLATAMRVNRIVTVPVMENLTRSVSGVTHNLIGIIVDLADYNIGADKGGAVNMFDDFDIDYNAEKYLIETRCSGALIRPKSAIVLEWKNA